MLKTRTSTLKKLGCSCLAFIFLFWLFGCSSSEDKLAAHLSRAFQYETTNNLDAAEIELKNAIQLDPGNATAFESLGRIYFSQGSIRKAFPVLSKALEIDPDNNEVKWRLAEIYLILGDTEKASSLIDEVLQKKPDHNVAPVIYANISIRQRKLDIAKSFLESLASEHPAKKTSLGLISVAEQKPEEAKQYFLDAIELDGSYFQASVALSNLHLIAKDPEGAENVLDESFATNTKAPAVAVRLAKLQFSQGRTEEGIATLETGLKHNTSHFGIIETLAQILADQRRFEESETHVQSLLRRDPVHYNGMILQGKLYLARGENDEATEWFEAVTQAYPNSGDASYHQALAYLANREVAKAIASLTKATTLEPNHSDAVIALAGFNAQQGDTADAVVALNKLLETNSNNTKAQILLAQILESENQYEEAIKIYSTLSEKFPTNPQFLTQLGNLQLLDQETDLARDSYLKALEISSTFPIALEKLTDLELATEGVNQAKNRIATLIQDNPDNAFLYALEGKIHIFEKNTEEAEAALMRSNEIQANPPATKMLAALYLQDEKIDEAVTLLENLKKLSPNDVESLSLLASTYERTGDINAARNTYESILSIYPDHGPSLNNLAYILSEQDIDLARAFELAKRAREEMPSDPSIADTLGWIAYKQGEYDWAVSLLQESARKIQHPDVHYHLAMALIKTGNNSEAELSLQKAIELGLASEKTAEAKAAIER